MNFGDRYGRADRLLHRIAFRAQMAQHALADVEALLHGDRLEAIPLERPVFIAALPRSGTTILLKLLWATGRFASHTYRDMPFVLCPLLWSRFASRFAADDVPVERAHGDGLTVSADSPEALEEMVWKRFWPDHYREDRILPWPERERNRDFDDFFATHMRKVIALRRDGPEDGRRYLSKNNLNLARLAAPPAPLREGVRLVPFREPVQHAASLLRQHRRFTRLHDEDGFVREYMAAVGHHEFGRTLKPVDYGGWLGEAPGAPTGLAFWLRYWVAAHRHLLEHAGPGTTILSYARLTEEPEAALADVAGAAGIPAGDLVPLADRLHPPRTHEVDRAGLPAALLDEATRLHRRLGASPRRAGSGGA